MKKFIFKSILILFPLIILLLIEITLRLVAYGDSFPLFIEDPQNPDYLFMNPDASKQYFRNHNLATKGAFDLFQKHKTDSTFRIFVQGASSAVGFPYKPSASFPRLLEERLQQSFPQKNIEVINLAFGGVSTYTFWDQAEEIIEQSPDAILIYAGHNEYYGTLGVASSQTVKLPPPFKRLYLKWSKHIKLVQLLRNLILQPHKEVRHKGTMMEKMVGQQKIALNSKIYAQGIEQFEGNISKLLEKYDHENIPVFLGSLISNLADLPPFIPDEGAENYFEQGLKSAKAENWEEAKSYFLQAKENDLLRFRAPEIINQLIKDLSQQFDNTTYTPIKEIFEEASPHGLVGENLLLEHVHPNTEGYKLMAETFYAKLLESGQIGAPETLNGKMIILPTRLDSIYGTMLVTRLKQNWPFETTEITAEPFAHWRPETLDQETAVALLMYRQQISWFEASNQLFQSFFKIGQYKKALPYAMALYQEIPYKEEPKLMLASVYKELEDWRGAQKIFESLLRSSRNEIAKKELVFIYLASKNWNILNIFRQEQTFDPVTAEAIDRILEFETGNGAEMSVEDVLALAYSYKILGFSNRAKNLLLPFRNDPKTRAALEELDAIIE